METGSEAVSEGRKVIVLERLREEKVNQREGGLESCTDRNKLGRMTPGVYPVWHHKINRPYCTMTDGRWFPV